MEEPTRRNVGALRKLEAASFERQYLILLQVCPTLDWPDVWDAMGASENPLSEGALYTTFNVVGTKVKVLAKYCIGMVVFVLARIGRRGSILILTHNLSPALIL